MKALPEGGARLLQESLVAEHIAVVAPKASVAAVEPQGLFRAMSGFLNLPLLAQESTEVAPGAVQRWVSLNGFSVNVLGAFDITLLMEAAGLEIQR